MVPKHRSALLRPEVTFPGLQPVTSSMRLGTSSIPIQSFAAKKCLPSQQWGPHLADLLLAVVHLMAGYTALSCPTAQEMVDMHASTARVSPAHSGTFLAVQEHPMPSLFSISYLRVQAPASESALGPPLNSPPSTDRGLRGNPLPRH